MDIINSAFIGGKMSDMQKPVALLTAQPANTSGRPLTIFAGPMASSDLLAFCPSHTFAGF